MRHAAPERKAFQDIGPAMHGLLYECTKAIIYPTQTDIFFTLVLHSLPPFNDFDDLGTAGFFSRLLLDNSESSDEKECLPCEQS